MSYVRCRNCRYCDPNETKGYKWYCEYLRIYVDPDEISTCSHFR